MTEADLEQLKTEARIGRMVMGRAATLGWKNDGESVLDFLMRAIPCKEAEHRSMTTIRALDANEKDPEKRLKIRTDMLRKDFGWIITLAQIGRTPDDPDQKPTDPPLSIQYLDEIENYAKSTVDWLDKHCVHKT